jgi:cbb3-type cytochrome oxidase maturation protein
MGLGQEGEVYALIWLLPITLVLAGGVVTLFLWCARSGQFEDLDGAAWRILQDDERARRPSGREPGDRQG